MVVADADLETGRGLVLLLLKGILKRNSDKLALNTTKSSLLAWSHVTFPN